jgi:hypothetical protein
MSLTVGQCGCRIGNAGLPIGFDLAYIESRNQHVDKTGSTHQGCKHNQYQS